MKKLPRLLAFICLVLAVFVSIPASGHQGCSKFGAGFGESSILSTGKSGTGANIDVVYHRFNWFLNPDAGRTISGSATTYFKTIVSNVQSISFDLHSNLSVTAVRFRGANLASSRITRSGHVLHINLGTSLAVNTMDSVTITYGGTPPAQSGGAEGFKLSGLGSDKYIWTLSESYEDRDWWPCKADMQDKIDSIDFVIDVPSAYWVAANGRLVDSTITGANRRFIFKHRYPIASYLVAIAVAKYTRYHRGAVNIGGRQVPIMYYIRSSNTNVNSALTAMDKVKEELQQFSLKFGDYPFKNEHYGMYEFGFSGGMEHQGFSGMSFSAMSSWSTIAHEVAHQWFGNKVTFASWNHLWIAEGFAKYLEVLAAELVPSLSQNPRSHRSSIRNSARTNAAYSAYIPDANAGTANGIWNSLYANSVYMRGAMVVSMLRTLLGDDKFFQACRNFLNDPQLAYKSATTEQLKNHFSTVAGLDLSPFFEDYVYNGGYPSYQVSYGTNNKRLTVQLIQTGRTSTTRSFMHTPVVLKVSNSAGNRDTTIVIYHQQGAVSRAGNGISAPVAGNLLYYNLSFIPASVSFDPDFKTMSSGSVNALASLPIEIESFSGKALALSNHLRLILRDSYQHDDIMLQRSWDGNRFSDLGRMQRTSASTASVEYIYSDENREEAKAVYYRARITDLDGSFVFTKIQKLESPESFSEMKVHPTIARDKIQVIFPPLWKDHKFRLILYDNAGRTLRRYYRENSAAFDIAVGDLPPGQYFLSAVNESHQKITRPFTIQY